MNASLRPKPVQILCLCLIIQACLLIWYLDRRLSRQKATWSSETAPATTTIALSKQMYGLSKEKLLPPPLHEFFDLPEREQQQFYDEFLRSRPQLYTRYLTKDDTVAPPQQDISSSALDLRYQLMECMMFTPISSIPLYEEYVEKPWAKNEFCSWNTFQIYRREQTLSRLLYCFAMRPDITMMLDMWTGYGGSSLTIAAGMTASGDGNKFLYTFEAHTFRAEKASERLERYPVELIFDSTLVPFTYNPNNPPEKMAEGTLLNLCKEKKFDAIFIDSVGSAGTHWENEKNELRKGQEHFVVRDFCKPKYIIASITHESEPWLQVAIESKHYELVFEGHTRGMACHPKNLDPRKWVVLVQKQE